MACRNGALFSSAAGGANWPIAIRCPSLGPFPSIGGGNPEGVLILRRVGNDCGTGGTVPFCPVDICIWGSFGAQSCIAVSSFPLPSPKFEVT